MRCDTTDSWLRASSRSPVQAPGPSEPGAGALGAELDIIWAANHMSMIDVWLGRYDDAGIAAREAVQRADQMGARQLLLTAWNVHAEVAARTGNEADARSTAAAAIAAAQVTGACQLAVAPTATLAFLEVSLGNYVA